jgi:hypothetical protein
VVVVDTEEVVTGTVLVDMLVVNGGTLVELEGRELVVVGTVVVVLGFEVVVLVVFILDVVVVRGPPPGEEKKPLMHSEP